MADNRGVTLDRLVHDVKAAILQAQGQLDPAQVQIKRVDLEVKTSFDGGITVGGKLQVIPLEASGEIKKTDVQTITLALIPVQPKLELHGSLSDELSGGIEIITQAIQEAATSAPAFELEEATVTLSFGVTKSGKISIILGGDVEQVSLQTVKLTLGRSPSSPDRG